MRREEKPKLGKGGFCVRMVEGGNLESQLLSGTGNLVRLFVTPVGNEKRNSVVGGDTAQQRIQKRTKGVIRGGSLKWHKLGDQLGGREDLST